MKSRGRDPRREQCDELARVLATDAGLRQTRLMEAAGLIGPPSGKAPPREPEGPEPIAIWAPRVEGQAVTWVRPPPRALGDSWNLENALVPRTDAARQRVVYIAESAGHGGFYAPHIKPARLLEHYLNQVSGREAFEVIDLAGAGLQMHELLELMRAALQLEPDVFVIHAGNNWNGLDRERGGMSDPVTLAWTLRHGGIDGVVRESRRIARELVDSAADEIAGIARSLHIPVVVVIPGINLHDFETHRPVPWMPGHELAMWYRTYERARRAVDARNAAGLFAAAEDLFQRSAGISPITHRLRGLALAGAGDDERACEELWREVEIDVALWCTWRNRPLPRAAPTTRAVLRAACVRHGFACVDLAAVFTEHTGECMANRRMYADYCHPTVEGMNVTAAATAAEVLRFGGEAPAGGWRKILGPAPALPAHVEALASFAIARHVADTDPRFSGRAPQVDYWCQRAVHGSAGIRDTFLDHVRSLALEACPPIWSAAARDLFARGEPQGIAGVWKARLNGPFIDAMASALRDAGMGVDEELAGVLGRNRTGPIEVELTSPYHRGAWIQFPDGPWWAGEPPKRLCRVVAPLCTFSVLCDRGPVALEATVRVPGGSTPEGTLRLSVNGAMLSEHPVGSTWTRILVDVPPEVLRPGLNELRLDWPYPSTTGEEALAQAMDRLERGIEASLYPVFGEIASLRARIGG